MPRILLSRATLLLLFTLLAQTPGCTERPAADLKTLNSRSSPSDWPMFLHDLNNTGYTPESVIPPLELLWAYGGGLLRSSPAVVNGMVYLSSLNNKTYALNATSGELVWSYAIGGKKSSPAVNDGVVYVGSWDSNVYALNATVGTLLWKSRTGTGRIYTPPAVAEGLVYVGDSEGVLHALDAETGELEWNFPAKDPDAFIESKPAVANGIVYVGVVNDPRVYALNARTGELIWEFQDSRHAEVTTTASPVVAGGIVYVRDSEWLYALNASSGELVWNYYISESDFPWHTPSVTKRFVYVGYREHFVALSAEGGIFQWEFSIYSPHSWVVSHDVVYVVGWADKEERKIMALDVNTGDFIWNHTMAVPIYTVVGPVVVANGMVYTVWGDGNLYAFRGATPGEGTSDENTKIILLYSLPIIAIAVAVVIVLIRKGHKQNVLKKEQ